MKVDLEVGLKMVKAHDPGARLKMVKVAHLSDPYLPPVAAEVGRTTTAVRQPSILPASAAGQVLEHCRRPHSSRRASDGLEVRKVCSNVHIPSVLLRGFWWWMVRKGVVCEVGSVVRQSTT